MGVSKCCGLVAAGAEAGPATEYDGAVDVEISGEDGTKEGELGTITGEDCRYGTKRWFTWKVRRMRGGCGVFLWMSGGTFVVRISLAM